MNSEEQAKSVISEYHGQASKQQIAREIKISLDYADFICRGLMRKGEIIFADGFYSFPAPVRKISQKSNRDKGQTRFSLSDITELAADVVDVLKREGYVTIESLADAPIAKLMQAVKLEVHEAAQLINHARKMLGKIKDTEAGEDGEETP